jgi:hypothetical protein
MLTRELSQSRWVLLCLAVLGAAMTSHGFEAKDLLAFGAGPFVIRPRLSVSEQYDDNIFYTTPDLAQGDFITTVNPGFDVRLGKGGGRAMLDVSYNFAELFYATSPYISDASQHTVSLSTGWQGNKVGVGLTASWSWADTIFGGYNAFVLGVMGTNLVLTETNIAPANLPRTSYGAMPSVSYALNEKLSAYLNASFTGTKFKEDVALYDVNNWRTTLGTDYAVRPKLRALVEVSYGQDAGDPNLGLVKYPHMDTLGGQVGVRGDLTRKISATFKGGYQQSTHGDDSFGAPVFSLLLAAKLTEKSDLSATYSRNTSLSAQGATAYISDYAGIQYGHTVGTAKPWVFGIGATYGVNSYQDMVAGNSEYLSANVGVTYQIKLWLRAALTYQFQKSWSGSNSTIDYSDNRVTLSASIGY